MALVELGRYPPPEAHMVVGLLDSAGIIAIAFDAGASVVEGSLAALIPVRVMVDDDDLPAAQAVLIAA